MPALRRLAGVALLAATYAPVHRLLDPAETGPAGSATRATAETVWSLGLSGTLIVLAFAWVIVRMAGPVGGRWWAAVATGMARPSSAQFALGCGVLATALGAVVATWVHGRSPTSVDAMAQLLHAQAVSNGQLGVPLAGDGAAWVIQNGIVVGGRWVSIYPPLHTLILAGGLTVGAAWLIGPIMIGIATGCATAAAQRLLGTGVGRAAGLLLAVSPFWLVLGATYSSHATAAAGLCGTLLAATVARDRGGYALGVATGAAVGFAVCARPWVGLISAMAILGALWLPGLRRAPLRFARLATGTLAGGVPFAALLLGWNTVLFGHPFRLGYSAAFGPSHGLGFHPDPWGNRYGATEALAYTGADLSQLGVRLFESPLPALALIGAALLVAPMARGARVFAVWAAAAVAANALYWHHGIQFGPRMLFESIPAWAGLFAISAATLVAPAHAESRGDSPALEGSFSRLVVMIAVIGGVALTPWALLGTAAGSSAIQAPTPPRSPAIVFVHGTWASRVAARLVASGMRRDSVETALRRNDICAVDGYARWRSSGSPGPAPLIDLESRSGTPASLTTRTLSPGNHVRVDPARPPEPRCIREARADRLGVLDLEHLAWRLPPLTGRPVRAVRDLGPAGNLAVLATSDAAPYVLVDRGPEGMVLVDYARGMELLWGGAAGVASGPSEAQRASGRGMRRTSRVIE